MSCEMLSRTAGNQNFFCGGHVTSLDCKHNESRLGIEIKSFHDTYELTSVALSSGKLCVIKYHIPVAISMQCFKIYATSTLLRSAFCSSVWL